MHLMPKFYQVLWLQLIRAFQVGFLLLKFLSLHFLILVKFKTGYLKENFHYETVL